MDKKSKYSQSTAKGAGPGDAKKTQDVVNGGKVFPKTSRRRESPGSAGFAGKNEQQSRKSGLQKARSFDKRPKPKGQYHGGAKEDTKVVEEEAAELGSVMVPGSKKQNLNHLLNFHYAPRDVLNNSGGWGNGRPHGNNNRWLPPVHRHKYNKEQFLQANCQFVVNDDSDYTAYLADPDTLVDWKLIEQIRIHSSENLSCPICLSPPVAGKMTRCGHVYCWPCILHYLALSDKAWRKCPICYESVHKSDLKSVVEVTQFPVNIGDHVKLHLMRRERGSLIAMPVGESDTPIPSTFIPVSKQNSSQIYSKLLLANVADVRDIIENERVQLKFELIEDPQSPENCFIEQALTELSTREQEISMPKLVKPEPVGPASPVGVGSNEPRREVEQPTESKKEPERNSDTSQCSLNLDGSVIYNEGSDIGKDEAGSEARALSKFFYFYQAEDGQHLYLHAMNVKMLELQYGKLEDCPRAIWGRVVEKEVGSFSEELRRRMRYLYHLPLTCQFEIAEIELAPPLITEEVLGYFAEQMENREKKRRRREREERKREKKITAEENKRMGKFPAAKVHIESHKHFPQWQPETAGMSVPSPPESLAPSSVASSPSRSSLVEDNTLTMDDYSRWQTSSANLAEQQQLGPSFAQMLRNTGSRMGGNVAWPSIGIPEPVRSRSSAVAIVSADNEEDAYAAAPSYNQSFGDALAQAFDQTEFLDTGRNNEAPSAPGKKKKKSKPTVLFATSMSRAS